MPPTGNAPNNEQNDENNNNGDRNNNPTILYNSTAKESKCNIHELSKFCKTEDQNAIRERIDEIVLKFLNAPQRASELIDIFLSRFTKPVGSINSSEENDYQLKSRTEDFAMFLINNNRIGMA